MGKQCWDLGKGIRTRLDVVAARGDAEVPLEPSLPGVVVQVRNRFVGKCVRGRVGARKLRQIKESVSIAVANSLGIWEVQYVPAPRTRLRVLRKARVKAPTAAGPKHQAYTTHTPREWFAKATSPFPRVSYSNEAHCVHFLASPTAPS